MPKTDGRPSQVSSISRGSNQLYVEEEEHSAGSSFEGDEEDSGAEETPDVQRVHFNQTVQALFNIRASGLTMPPYHTIQHLLVDLPQPN